MSEANSGRAASPGSSAVICFSSAWTARASATPSTAQCWRTWRWPWVNTSAARIPLCRALRPWRAHTAGLDLMELAPKLAASGFRYPDGGVDPWGVVQPRRSKPLVVAVQGTCWTAGIELMLNADIAVAARARALRPSGGATRHPAAGRIHRALPARGGPTPCATFSPAMSSMPTKPLRLLTEVVEPGEELARASNTPSGSPGPRRWRCAPRCNRRSRGATRGRCGAVTGQRVAGRVDRQRGRPRGRAGDGAKARAGVQRPLAPCGSTPVAPLHLSCGNRHDFVDSTFRSAGADGTPGPARDRRLSAVRLPLPRAGPRPWQPAGGRRDGRRPRFYRRFAEHAARASAYSPWTIAASANPRRQA